MSNRLTIYGALMLLSFCMGLFTCRTCTRPPIPAKGDTVTVIKRDTIRVDRPVPVRVTVPEMARVKAGEVPKGQVVRIPYPVYLRGRDDSCTHLYDKLYEDHVTRRDHDNTYPFGSDTVRVKSTVQGNHLWEQQVYLAHAEKILTTPAPKLRNQVWWGASGYYRGTEIGVGTSLMFVHKRGIALEAGAGIGTSGVQLYQAGVKWKIGKRY